MCCYMCAVRCAATCKCAVRCAATCKCAVRCSATCKCAVRCAATCKCAVRCAAACKCAVRCAATCKCAVRCAATCKCAVRCAAICKCVVKYAATCTYRYPPDVLIFVAARSFTMLSNVFLCTTIALITINDRDPYPIASSTIVFMTVCMIQATDSSHAGLAVCLTWHLYIVIHLTTPHQ